MIKKILLSCILFNFLVVNVLAVSTSFYHEKDISGFENLPPSIPIIDGPHNISVNKEYSWTFLSTDPEGSNITYYVDWGDKCGNGQYYGPFASGEQISLSHIYTQKNKLFINAIAIDEDGAESDMGTFEIIIPRERSYSYYLIIKFLNHFFSIF